jgi:hypothetical protein
MLRKICEFTREDVTGHWRTLHKGKLRDFYCSPNIILVIKSKMIQWMTCIRQKGNAYWVLVRKCEEKRMLGRP